MTDQERIATLESELATQAHAAMRAQERVTELEERVRNQEASREVVELRATVARLTGELAEARKLCGEAAPQIERWRQIMAEEDDSPLLEQGLAQLGARLRAAEKGGGR